MPRIRTIKPEFPQSESMGRISRDSRLLFIQMWTLSDDSGRLRGNSRMLASLLFPYDSDASELMDSWLAELARELCITSYEIEGQHYIQICNWLNHQKIDKPSPSKIPAFVEPSRKVAKRRERSSLDQGPRTKEGTKDQGRDQGPKEGNGIKEPNAIALVATGPDGPADPPKKRAKKTEPAPTSATWDSYAAAYRRRYGMEPVRNALVNGQLASLVGRLGADDAPPVAAFFVEHDRAFYVAQTHPVSLLLKDCEGLRTQWATGRKVMAKDAQEVDRIASDGGMWGRVRDKLSAKEVIGG